MADAEKTVMNTDRYCPRCRKDTPLATLVNHSIGLLHAVCAFCGFCGDCDEGNV